MKKFILVNFILAIFAIHSVALGDINVEKASVNGKYSNLLQVLKCEKDRATYGEFSEYGKWSGGAWCGQTGKSGYWVWVAPKWYIWKDKNQNQIPPKASLNGKYSNLLQILKCEKDRATYGEFSEYGKWSGGAWCGQTGKSGYWIWLSPNWYIWATKNR